MPGRLPDPRPGVPVAQVAAAVERAATPPPDDEYTAMSVDELRVAATAAGIRGRSTMRRRELIAALRRR